MLEEKYKDKTLNIEVGTCWIKIHIPGGDTKTSQELAQHIIDTVKEMKDENSKDQSHP